MRIAGVFNIAVLIWQVNHCLVMMMVVLCLQHLENYKEKTVKTPV